MPSIRSTALAGILFAAACLGAGVQSALAGPKPADESYTTDARSTASDAQVAVARRAYRAACERRLSTGYCECMTGGMAQELSPSELAIATAAFSGQHVSATATQRARVEAVRAEYEPGCASFR